MKRLIKTLVVLAVLLLLGAVSVLGMFFVVSSDLPQINSLNDYNPPMNSQIFSRDGELLLDIGVENREVVPFEKIPKKVVDVFLAAEDDNFYSHEGVDYKGIARAFITNMKEGRLVQGGSTITQQVAKSFLLSKERTISRKIKDLLLARKIEDKFSKEEILYLYLNQVYLGGGYYGVKAAIKGYFDKELEEATPAESALVAGLLVAPGKYSPYVNPQYAKRRQKYVIRRLFETGKISKQEYEDALKEDIKMRLRKTNEFKGGHFTDWIRQEVMRAVGTEQFLTNGFKVITTLDWKLQEKAEMTVKARIKELDKRQGFKGPIKQLASDDDINTFLVEHRKKILRDQSTFFTFSVDGKNTYEFHEPEDVLQRNLTYYEGESERINERFKKLVDIGNPNTDPFNEFLQVGASYQAVVLKVDNLKRSVLVSVGGTRAIIPESGFEWAHERKFGEDPVWFAPQKTPSRILKRGDVVLVQIEQKSVSLDQLTHAEFFKKNKDPSLKGLFAKQRFFRASLDQEPEAEGAMIAINAHNGEVITLVGGVDFQKSQFNRAIQSSRQPGSSFKPFIYAAALESGHTPASILMDTPQALGGTDNSLNWKPRNYDGEFKGPMTLRSALEVSRNIPTVRLVQDLGVSRIHEFIARLHINAEIPKDMSLSLGSFGISLAELTKAYAIFPNGGKAVRLKNIISIKDRDGKAYTLPAADPEWISDEGKSQGADSAHSEENTMVSTNPFLDSLNAIQVYDPRLAYVMANLLRGVTLYGTGAAAGKLGPNIGGKTGTTNNYVDALFVGFTNNIVVGAWAGFDDNRSMGHGETGGRTALPIWVDFMGEAITRYGASEFVEPEGISKVFINKETGNPLPPGMEGFMESFVTGTEPGTENKIILDQNAHNAVPNDEEYWNNQ